MRPIERKVMKSLKNDTFTVYDVEEIVDSTSRTELKKSYPDDSHFQSAKYFAKSIVNALLRYKLIERDGSKFKKVQMQKSEK